MENIETDNHFNHTNNDDYDVLSLRDLQMYDHTPTSSNHSSPRNSNSSGQQLFEFFPNRNPIGTGDIVFCGKVINGSVDDNELNDQYQNPNYLTLVGSSSFKLPKRPIEHVIPIRSVSDREIGSGRHAVKFSSSVKKVNITALTSMSSKSRRRMFMFGPVKFKPEMEMSAIKERQGRRGPPSRMFPVAEGGESGEVVVGGHKRHGDTVKTLTCRSRLNNVFERSIACLRF